MPCPRTSSTGLPGKSCTAMMPVLSTSAPTSVRPGYCRVYAAIAGATDTYATFADNYDSTAPGGYIYATTINIGGVYRCQFSVPAPWTRIDNVTGAPTAAAIAVPAVAADSAAFTFTDPVGAATVTIFVPTGTLSITNVGPPVLHLPTTR